MEQIFKAERITVKPQMLHFYMPPVVFHGDPIGHIGENDVFFWVLEGEAVLLIEEACYVLRAGQLAFLPKGKFRRYFGASKNFILYTMGFFAEADGVNLMEGLGLTERDHVVTIENKEEMTAFFESSSHVEMYARPMNNLLWNSHILSIIGRFLAATEKRRENEDERFLPVIDLMKANLDRNLSIDELAAITFMQDTYFIKRFKKIYGSSPINYFKSLRMNKAIELLLTTDLSLEKVAADVGMDDVSYFSRWFKKGCGRSPNEYRRAFSIEKTAKSFSARSMDLKI